MGLLKPVCKACQRFYRPEKNGYFFTEMMPKGGVRAPSGTEAPDEWEPYKIWVGDLWKCQGCGHELVVGVIAGPVSEHYMPGFASVMENSHAGQLKVNDC